MARLKNIHKFVHFSEIRLPPHTIHLKAILHGSLMFPTSCEQRTRFLCSGPSFPEDVYRADCLGTYSVSLWDKGQAYLPTHGLPQGWWSGQAGLLSVT